MIELQNVDFAYDDKPILRDVSFRVDDGEAVAVMGPSGSGKSTILRLILGLDCPQNGKIMIDGRNICVMKEKEKRQVRKKIGMVFQDGALFNSLTVGENVGYYLIENTSADWEEIDHQVRTMLGFVGLDPDELIDKLPEHLSGGMQRRVAIGRALLSTNPTLMLYDEPTTGLDPQSTENVLKLIEKLHHERDLATVVVTHQIADAFVIADRYVVLLEGRVVFDGSFHELRGCHDGPVAEFLAPFRASMTEVVRSRFFNDIGGA